MPWSLCISETEAQDIVAVWCTQLVVESAPVQDATNIHRYVQDHWGEVGFSQIQWEGSHETLCFLKVCVSPSEQSSEQKCVCNAHTTWGLNHSKYDSEIVQKYTCS